MSVNTKLKDNEGKLKQSGVVYGIPCGACDGVYVGQTDVLNNIVLKHKGIADLSNILCTVSASR